MITCIENLVGLTSSNCNCFDGDKPANFSTLNASTSGYFMDEYLNVRNEIYASINCEDGANIFTKMVEMRNTSQANFQTDLQAVMRKLYDSRIMPFSGEIGQRKSNDTRQSSLQFAGMQIQPQQLKDAKLIITNIYTGFDTTGTVNLIIDSNDPDFAQQTMTLNNVANVFNKNTLTTPLELPFYVPVCENYDCGLKYNFYYNKTLTTGNALNNKFFCCGSRPAWRSHLGVGGFDTNDVDSVCGCTSEYAYGLVLEGYITCDNLNWICNLEQLNGFDLQDVIARSIQFKSTITMAQYILDSNNINYYTLLNREQLYGKIKHFSKRYAENLHWIASSVNDKLSSLTGCYKCKTFGQRVNN